jgi:Family of unknown function (DUF6328)
MTQLQDKIQYVLDESRILILGAQVLVGFHYRAAFERGFQHLPETSQALLLAALGLLLLAFALLIWPAAYHRLVAKGQDTDDLHRFATRVLDGALVPFAVSLAIDLYVATVRLTDHAVAGLAGLAILLAALLGWYGLAVLQRPKRRPSLYVSPPRRSEMDEHPGAEPMSVQRKLQHVLTEARMVLPGAQALLGFQLATILLESFEQLPSSSQAVHLASLGLIALSTILLMAPAAYHRLVEQGEATERFHAMASRMVLAAMVPLALGLVGDCFVVVRKVTGTLIWALVSATLLLVVCYGLWFGVTLYGSSPRLRTTR